MTNNSGTQGKDDGDAHLTRAAKLEATQLHKMCPPEQEPVLTILRARLLSFAQKLNLVEGLDLLPDQLIQSLRGLNRVRNSCAHEMEREITIPDVERIGRPFGAEFTALRQKHYPDVKQLLNEVTKCVGRDLSGLVYFRERNVAEKFEKQSSSKKT